MRQLRPAAASVPLVLAVRRSSARFLGPLLIVGVLLAAGCRSVGGAGRPEAEPAPGEPSISAGTSAPGADSLAAGLVEQARAALSAGDAAAAAAAAAQVVSDYPTAAGSSAALDLLARASVALEDWDAALDAAGRHAVLFLPSDVRHARSSVIAARALLELQQAERAARTLLALPEPVPGDAGTGALELMRRAAAQLDAETLAALLAESGSGVLATPLAAEQALGFYLQGDTAAARIGAEALIGRVGRGPEYDVARAILDGDAATLRAGVSVLGTMLAETGSPGLVDFSTLIHEGVEVAAALYGDDARRPVELRSLDDRGTPSQAAAVMNQLEEAGALAVVGPLLGSSVEAAVPARRLGTVLISPTARTLPDSAPGVYSLSAPDPGAGQVLAGYVRDQGLRRVVVLRPVTQGAIREARSFRETLEGYGIPLLGEVAYDSGATFFQDQLREVAGLRPDGLVLPLPAPDVELLAPQITFFGLDTLGIQLMGTAGWASDQVVGSVDPRHTTGVVVATPTVPGVPPPGRDRFVSQYETRFRKTLRSPVPALGFDAASLALEAMARSGARTAGDLVRSLEDIRDYPGATGTLSVVDGHVRRAHTLVRFVDGAVRPLSDPIPPQR